MIDIFTDLPWQHQVLFIEAIISPLVSIAIIVRGFRRTWFYTVFGSLWDSALAILLVAGADDASWQHVTLFLYYLLNVALVIGYGVAGKKSEPEKNPGGIATFAVVIIAVTLTLLVTG